MKRELIQTADGSTTIRLPEINEHYHSKHGALQESVHVFIKMGLHYRICNNEKLNVLEYGFGTGLNALLTYFEAAKLNTAIHYTTLEAFPILGTEWKKMNYGTLINKENGEQTFAELHEAPWQVTTPISNFFEILKLEQKFEDFTQKNQYDLVYFDAFGARVQPELWTETIFEKVFLSMKPKGILVTYSAKGSVRRAMQSVGFEVERLVGPPGKREMLRATKK